MYSIYNRVEGEYIDRSLVSLHRISLSSPDMLSNLERVRIEAISHIPIAIWMGLMIDVWKERERTCSCSRYRGFNPHSRRHIYFSIRGIQVRFPFVHIKEGTVVVLSGQRM